MALIVKWTEQPKHSTKTGREKNPIRWTQLSEVPLRLTQKRYLNQRNSTSFTIPGSTQPLTIQSHIQHLQLSETKIQKEACIIHNEPLIQCQLNNNNVVVPFLVLTAQKLLPCITALEIQILQASLFKPVSAALEWQFSTFFGCQAPFHNFYEFGNTSVENHCCSSKTCYFCALGTDGDGEDIVMRPEKETEVQSRGQAGLTCCSMGSSRSYRLKVGTQDNYKCNYPAQCNKLQCSLCSNSSQGRVALG